MKNLKKLMAIALVIVMVAAMGANVFALDTDEVGVGTSGTAITQVEVPKEIVLFNTAESAIYEPNITYTYTLAPQNPSSATITDANGMTGTVKTGVNGLVTIQGSNGSGYTGSASTSGASLVFGDDAYANLSDTNLEGATVTTSSEVASRNLKLAFDTSVLSGSDAAGIYRFKITDTTTAAALTAAGIARDADYDADRYLDVYVEWADAAHSSLQVYGWVLYKTTDGTNDVDGVESFSYDASEETAVKVDGYNVESEMLDGASTADEYHTYNLSVTKTTTGTLADKNHEFPVAVSFANATVTSQTDFYSTGDYLNNALALSAAGAYSTNTDFSGTPSVKNGDTFTFIGLPAGTTFLVNEKNDTVDSYKVTISDETIDTDLKAESIITSGNNTGLSTYTALGNDNSGTPETENIQILNKLEAISPTGIVLRFAPFAIILMAGIALFMLSRRRNAVKA